MSGAGVSLRLSTIPCPQLSPLPQRGRGAGGEGSPQRGRGAGGEGRPHLPPAPLPLPRCGRGGGDARRVGQVFPVTARLGAG